MMSPLHSACPVCLFSCMCEPVRSDQDIHLLHLCRFDMNMHSASARLPSVHSPTQQQIQTSQTANTLPAAKGAVLAEHQLNTAAPTPTTAYAAKSLTKAADASTSGKEVPATGDSRQTAVPSHRHASVLQPATNSLKASSSLQLNFGVKSKPVLFPISKAATQSAQTTAAGQTARQGMPLLSSLKRISGGASGSKASHSLPFKFGKAPTSSISQAPSQATSCSPAPAAAQHANFQAGNRQASAVPTSFAQIHLPRTDPSAQKDLPAKQPSMTSTVQAVQAGNATKDQPASTSTETPHPRSSSPHDVNRAPSVASQGQREDPPSVRSNILIPAVGQTLQPMEDAEAANQTRTPWTTHSMAGDFMQNTKLLERVSSCLWGLPRSTCLFASVAVHSSNL